MAAQKHILLFLLLFWGINASAREYPKVVFPLSGTALMGFSGAAINFSANYPNVNSSNLGQLNNTNKITAYQNTIELILKNQSAFNEDAKVTVTATLQYFPLDNSPAVTKTITLEINYKAGALTKTDISNIYAFKNAYKVVLTITNVVVVADIGTDQFLLKTKLKDFIELDAGFVEDRVTRIDYNSAPAGPIACRDQVTDELVISWGTLPDAEAYELEYTFVDDYGDNYNAPLNANGIDFNFKDNSTRVTLKDIYYRIPLTFERGYLLYRVRAVGWGGANLNLPAYCRWTGADAGKAGAFADKYYHNTAHMADKMNWQAATTFAEDGKRADAVTYFDGTFRSRQKVTGMNLERQLPYDQPAIFLNQYASGCAQPGNDKEREVIAGETIYDYQGRPAVNILPTPTNSKKLEYLPLLNISNATQKPYAWQDFDKPDFTCPDTHELSQLPNAQTGIMGAAAYYSPNNPNKLGFNAFIPDAAGWPFTQLNYEQDNTGKVAAQSQVGATFKFGNNHETRFYYAAPNQEELDRMFGTEAGDASRYQKNAVMDANRQVSVSYINPEGKTIATALAGTTPANLDVLDNITGNTIDISLMSKNVSNADDLSLTTTHQFLVTSDNTSYTFDYSINPETLDTLTCSGVPVCLDCIYDISITLNNIANCTSSPLVNYSGTIGNLLNSAGQTDLHCDNNINTGSYPRQVTRTLGTGTYVLTKKVTVNRLAGLAYVAAVFKDTCQAKWNDILHDELSKIDTMSCYQSCTSCGQPPVQTTTCDTVYCKPSPNRCDDIHTMMQADVSPGGQYGQFTRDANGNVDASAYPLSVFNPGNLLPVPQINFSLFPGITNINDLINNWQPGYAEKLVYMHPEACLSGWCSTINMDATLDFDMQILSVQHLADAVTNGYFTPGSALPNNNIKPYEQLLNRDPWFSGGQNAAEKATLLAKLQQYGCSTSPLPIDEVAMQMAYCANTNPPQNQQGTPVMNPPSQPCTLPAGYFSTHGFGTGTDQALADLEWTFLRSMYLSAKNEVLQSNMNSYADHHSCNSRCVGTKDYNDWAQFHLFPGGFSVLHNFLPCQSSQYPFVWLLYKDKQSRFSTGIDNIMNVTADAGVTVNLSGVTNYDDPCQFAQAIAAQSASINQQTASTICGGAGSDCNTQLSTGLTDVINQVITQLKTSPSVTILHARLPSIIANAGVTNVVGTRANDNSLSIGLLRCSNFSIPYLRTPAGYQAPLSVCCVSNISCPGNANCSFDIKVLYPGGASSIVQIKTQCNFFAGCKDTVKAICSQPTVYATAIKDYLTDIFNFKIAYPNYPSQAQLGGLLPAVLQAGNAAPFVTLNPNGNFVINMAYNAGGTTKNCAITLQSNQAISNWSNVKNVISISPDLSLAQNGFTRHFILKVLSGTTTANTVTVNVNGSITCFDMNECPPATTLCNSTPPVMPAYPVVNNCVKNKLATAYSNASVRYNAWVDSMKNNLLQRYYAKCIKAVETLNMKYDDRQYQYTLYYYDQAGNLAKTVPPSGAKLLDHTQALAVAASRAAGYNTALPAAHIKTTVYRYNTLNELIWQQTPDAGPSNFFYDGLGRIAASQNAVQYPNYYSYTRYDVLGRPVEAGKVKSTGINAVLTRDFAGWTSFINTQPDRSEITLTRYDESWSAGITAKFGPGGQRNLRKRIASVFSFENNAMLTSQSYTHATHYSYDIIGDVYKVIQDYPNGIIGDKTLDYDFDLQSGKVNKVTYQRGAADQFIHSYNYDAANRLTQVKTSTNGLIWETDAEYKYYGHGPLARMELGTDKVQGLDYMYTVQGWAKGVNGTASTPETDMGQDGSTAVIPQTPPQVITFTIFGITYSIYLPNQLAGNNYNGPGYGPLNNPVARDAFGYVLDYFPGDYAAIQGNANLDGLSQQAGTVRPLFNGNISRMYTQIQTLGNNGYNYTYDQLNRIRSQEAWNLNNGAMTALPNYAYFGKFSYDRDGNIINQTRNGAGGTAMDNMDYFYYDANNNVYNPALTIPANATNKLAYVTDQVPDGNYPNDIDNQNPNNYKYDAIGDLIGDNAEHISQITWNLQRKINTITKTTGTILQFQYDALGNRVMKKVSGSTAAENGITFYVRDAGGNIMATYNYTRSGTSPQLYWSESAIYGSNRIGMFQPGLLIPPASAGTGTIATTDVYYTGSRGYKQYELTNHLGNVLATISDRKLPVTTNGGITYTADILSGQDYYAFGMQMPGRGFANGNYRFGFNGKENDNEVKGKGEQQDYGMRIYDPRLGRFLSVDPLIRQYPWYTPYQFTGNNPIRFIDADGSEPKDPPGAWINPDGKMNWGDHYKNGTTLFRIMDNETLDKYWVTKKVNANGSIGWQWYDQAAKKWQQFTPQGYGTTTESVVQPSNADIPQYNYHVIQIYGKGMGRVADVSEQGIKVGLVLMASGPLFELGLLGVSLEGAGYKAALSTGVQYAFKGKVNLTAVAADAAFPAPIGSAYMSSVLPNIDVGANQEHLITVSALGSSGKPLDLQTAAGFATSWGFGALAKWSGEGVNADKAFDFMGAFGAESANKLRETLSEGSEENNCEENTCEENDCDDGKPE